MVTLPFSDWKVARHASMADSCDDAPAPFNVPANSTTASPVEGLPAELDVAPDSLEGVQAASSSERAAAETTAPERSAMFTKIPYVLTQPGDHRMASR